jgi:MoaA/NifB/PqqE/SkfB family radical SAM enzyme
MGCPQSDLTRKRGFMEVDVFKRVVDEAVAFDSRTWLHFMGEPLMHPHIFEMIEYAADRGLGYFGISTNGLLLSDENIDRVLDSPLQRFEISLDAIDPGLFAVLRPGGSPERIIENAHEFFRRKYARNQNHPITSVSTRIMKQNAAHVREFAEYWNAILQPPDFILGIGWNSWGGHEGLEQATYEVTGPRVPCLKLWTTAFVLSDGMVVTCDPMWNGQVPMGNVNESSLQQIWTGDVYTERRRAHLEGRYEELAVCDNCTDWYRETSEETHRNLSSTEDMEWAEIRAVVSGGTLTGSP